jgi:glucose/arabinose dehydrogenase
VARAARLLGLVVALALAAVALSAAASPKATRAVTVRVDARDFSFKLSRRAVPAGSTVRFVVSNRGKVAHDFVVKGKRTRLLRPGRSQTITVAFPRKGSFRFHCSVPGHARLGMKGTFTVSPKPAPVTPQPPPIDVSDRVTLTAIGSFDRPVLLTAPPGDTHRLFVVEQTGLVKIVRDGALLPTPFLDLRDKIKFSSEPGLLSVAFAPDYETSGLFYTFYNSTAGNGDIRISEFRRSESDPDVADPYSERILLTIVKPWENHNGGMLQFGPAGNLWASVGDGDSGVVNPPGFYAQRKDSLLGTILRIDPRHGDPYAIPADNPFVGDADARPEVWAYGLRNPWRFWIDAPTRTLYVGDAGNAQREEINVDSIGTPGLTFGWPCFEGTLPFDTTAVCAGASPPLLDYPRADPDCAVIGGVVARDPRIPVLAGRYLYGDFCAGSITAIAVENGRVTASDTLDVVAPRLTSFGVDGSGRVYALSLGGEVFRIDPKP